MTIHTTPDYTITETVIDLQDSVDVSRVVTIKHSEGEVVLTFAFGEILTVEKT